MPVGEFDYAKALVPVFLSLYEQSQAMLKRFNPCNVCDGVCERHRRGAGENFCCKGCVYLGPQGCQVKALQCALWVCRYDLIPEVNQKAWNDTMWGIMLEANKFHLLVPRGGMEASIAQACRYYIEHRDERDALMKAALAYKPRPCFFPPPAQSSTFVKRWFGPLYGRSFEPTGSHRPDSVLPNPTVGTVSRMKKVQKPEPVPYEEKADVAIPAPEAKAVLPEDWADHFEEILITPAKEAKAAEAPPTADSASTGAVMKDLYFQWPN